MTHSSPPDSLLTFRAELRAFLQEAIPADIAESVKAHCLVTREQAERWQRILHARGWAAPGWPKEHGGPGWTLLQQAIFKEELAASPAPVFENLGIDTIGPTLLRHGTPEQCAWFMPRILSFDDYWAQCYSEPGAGSDLASLRTTAQRDGGDWIVNGTKIWQSYGHWANWALVLVRSNAQAERPQDGISVLLVDLRTPGVTVRPIRFINGSQFHSEIFFDGVRVPDANRVGPVDGGWRVAKGLLVTERLFAARLPDCRAELHHLTELATAGAEGGDAAALDDTRLAARHAELEIRLRAHEEGWWRALEAAEAGAQPELESSLLKVQGSELLQDIQQVQSQVIGLEGMPYDALAVQGRVNPNPWSSRHLENLPLHIWRYRGVTLGAGTSEVQRQIIARAVFGGQTAIDQPNAGGLSDEQAMLDDGLRRLLRERCGFDVRRSQINDGLPPDPSVWKDLAGLGLTGLWVPEADGGFGGEPADLLPLMETAGEALLLEPLLWSAVVATQLYRDASGFARRSERLQALLSGDEIAVLAHVEQSATPFVPARTTQARSAGTGWVLSGQKRFVMGADRANHFVVSARLEGGGLTLFEVPADAPGLQVRSWRSHDGRGAGDLRFEDLVLSGEALVAGPERSGAMLDDALALGTLGLCADSLGAMRRALALSVDYLRTRRQFGRALAEQQVLQHRVAEHFRGWFGARGLVSQALRDWTSDTPHDRTLKTHSAKWACGRVGCNLGLDGIQLHGAVGMQDETPISHFARRLVANDMLLGDAHAHLGAYAALRSRLRKQSMAVKP